MLLPKKPDHVLNGIPIPSLDALRWVSHGDHILSDVTQVQIKSILDIPSLLLGDHFLKDVPAALVSADANLLIKLFDVLVHWLRLLLLLL